MKRLSLFVGLFLLIVGICSFGLTATNIVIGANYELTGNVAMFGQACLNSAKLAVDECNANGGIMGGRKFKLAIADNMSVADEAGKMAAKLITQDKAVAIVGPVTSSNSFAAAPICQERGVLMITPTGTNLKVTAFGTFIFRACFIDPFQGEVMANFALKNLQAKKAAMMVETSSDYAKGLASFFKAAFIKGGGKVVAEEGFMTEDTDFRAVLNKIRLQNPDVLFVPSYYNQDGLIAKQAREMGMKMPILGGDGWDSVEELPKIAGADALNNIFFSNHFSPQTDNPLAKKFIAAYKARFDVLPDALAALGYDAARLIIYSINRAKSTKPDRIRAVMATTKGFPGVAGSITMNKDRNPVKGAVIIELINGVQKYRATVEP